MATYDAVTLVEAKQALGIDGTDGDEALARLISAVTLQIERLLRTQFVQRSVVEYHEGGTRRFYPAVTPIVSVTSIVDPAGNAVPSTQFVIRQKRFIEHWGHFFTAVTTAGQPTDWTLTYTAGWFASTAVVSADVKAEVIRAVGALREAPAADVASIGVGDLSISYSGTSAEPSPATRSAATNLSAYTGVLL